MKIYLLVVKSNQSLQIRTAFLSCTSHIYGRAGIFQVPREQNLDRKKAVQPGRLSDLVGQLFLQTIAFE